MNTDRGLLELGLAYGGMRVRVRSPDGSHLVWLQEFLCPHFQEIPVGTCEWSVRLSEDDHRYGALLSAGPRADGVQRDVFGLDSSVIRLPVWSSAPGETTVFDEATGVFCSTSTDGREISLLTGVKNRLARLHLMRVVRELAMDEARREGNLIVHAAVLELDGRGVVIAGGKAAGKTTLLASLLRQPGARYVSNDRVVVSPGSETPTLRGMPTLVMVRDGTLDLLPALRRRLEDSARGPFVSHEEAAVSPAEASRPVLKEGRYALSPGGFCSLLGVSPLGQCRAWSLVFPRWALNVNGWEARRIPVETAAPLLRAARFGTGSAKKPPELFGGPAAVPFPDESALERVSDRFASQVRCFECLLGPDAHASQERAADLLRRLTGRD